MHVDTNNVGVVGLAQPKGGVVRKSKINHIMYNGGLEFGEQVLLPFISQSVTSAELG